MPINFRQPRRPSRHGRRQSTADLPVAAGTSTHSGRPFDDMGTSVVYDTWNAVLGISKRALVNFVWLPEHVVFYTYLFSLFSSISFSFRLSRFSVYFRLPSYNIKCICFFLVQL